MTYPPLSMPVGPLTPYVSPDILTTAPTGIAWSTIPPGKDVTPAQRLAAQANICAAATAQADEYCNQVLRATIDNESLAGPNFRVTMQQGTGNTRVILSRWPVLAVSSIQVSPNVFPRQWQTIPSDQYEPEFPPIGLYGTNTPSSAGGGGQSIIIGAGYVNWVNGRQGYQLKISYINGWPHTSLTQSATAGTTTINVDDCTGWGPLSATTSGATGVLYDGAYQEVIQVVSASVTAGPGTLTLASGLKFAHSPGVLCSTMPWSIIWACTLFGAAMALTRGATATTVHAIPGGAGNTMGPKAPSDLTGEGELLLHPYRRTI